ncbi:MAG: hypothetical protein B6D59_01320 [Campylobacteraceae bacterium 4484_4]|nr:MAG: hypothetical protein B6D59_01320 [Campylobacteraceae bacterium 4484_4]
MLFGKIDYINLAPFHLFLKRYIRNSQLKQSIEYKKSYPARINRLFCLRKIDAAFISSIESRGKRCFDVGIVARSEIRSVLIERGSEKNDPHSATSNALAKLLHLQGEVIIGDKALKAWTEEPERYIDLARLWYEKEGVPFVFARFCTNRNRRYYRKLTRRFVQSRIRLPAYFLNRYARNRGIPPKEIKSYLKLVEYKIDAKAKRGLHRFLKKV